MAQSSPEFEPTSSAKEVIFTEKVQPRFRYVRPEADILREQLGSPCSVAARYCGNDFLGDWLCITDTLPLETYGQK